MAPCKAACSPPATEGHETGNDDAAVATGGSTAAAAAFEPCVWNDFFVTYTPPVSQALYLIRGHPDILIHASP
jgi:hypothetical protein